MDKSGIAASVISLPQGGGAIAGIDDSFVPDLHTGAGNLSVPLALLPGRNGFQPLLTLTYSTGEGNGPFGLGWALSVPSVARDTRNGVPRYDDKADVFLLSGAERLVMTKPAGEGVTLYRPRTEGLFARIQHRVSDQDDYWEVRSRSGQRSLYGTPGGRGTDQATLRDPDDPRRIFAWNLTQTFDPFGNRIDYLYELDAVAEAGPHRWDQLRLNTVRYADWGSREAPQFLVTVEFFYEDRPDPFSNYRAGFEIRHVKRCSRIEIRSHADGGDLLARHYRLTYQDQLLEAAAAGPGNGLSLLRRIETIGVDGDKEEAMPPLDLAYSRFDPTRRVYRALGGRGDSVPERSLAHPDFELADLFGRGLPDVVQIGDVSRYWRNLGGGCFDVPRPLDRLPAGLRLGDSSTQLADVDGDGQIDLLLLQPGFEGYLPLTARGPVPRPFIAYGRAPPFAFEDPELRLVDLDGDGITDALRTGENFELFYHERRKGWTSSQIVARDALDRFPDVRFSDPRVKLADMTGGGLQDIVLIDGARVDYWPSLGRGRWGRRITMAGRLDFPDASFYGGRGFDPQRLLLGDIDGDGAADLVYVESGRVTIWLNQSGNGWSEPITIRGTPSVADTDAVRLADMLGTGAAGILWTYDARSFADSTYKFLDLTGGTKPYLLISRDNNAGAKMTISYAPSTRFYEEDEKQPETRWQSRLPFPVQVVASLEVIDAISGGKLTSEFHYHQGYWDGDEREFRGFGIVDQIDSESFAAFNAPAPGVVPSFLAIDETRFSPPTLTRTWFHQGQLQADDGSWQESGSMVASWPEDPQRLPPGLRVELDAIAQAAALEADPVRLRHALRSLRGSVLRTEFHGLGGTANSDRPYTVAETLYDVREIEADAPNAANRLRIFLPLRIATRSTQWERGSDPMTQFAFAGGFDDYGLPRSELSIAVPRGRDPMAMPTAPGQPFLATQTVTDYAQRDDDAVYIVDRVARNRSYEIPNDGSGSVLDVRQAVAAGSASLTPIADGRSFYDGEAFTGLPLGQIGDYGVVVRSEALAFTDAFLAETFDASDPLSVGARPCYLDPSGSVGWTQEYPTEFRTALPPLAGYTHYTDQDVPGSPAGYYTASERHRYDFQDPGSIPRGLRRASRDELGAETGIDYDGFDFLPVRATDPAGMTVEAAFDYRIFRPRLVTDANGNPTVFAYSPSGLLSEQYARGKNDEGDANAPGLRLEYDLLAFVQRRQPMSVRGTRRTYHDTQMDIPAAERDATLCSVAFSDGFGRLIQQRIQAPDTLFGDPVTGGSLLPSDPSAPIPPATGRSRRPGDPVNVVVSGWQVFDNKGRVVEKYDPFFSQGWDYAAPVEAQLAEKDVMFRDPRGQVIRTLYPDGSEQRVVFGIPQDLTDPTSFVPSPWEAYSYDANDNAGRTHATAAAGYRNHWNTPSSVLLDPLGRAIASVQRNGPDPATDWYRSQSSFDIQGRLISVTDPLGRIAFRYVYDLLGRRWRADSIDAGRQDCVPDAMGNAVEARDSKGALGLDAYDLLHRPSQRWARDARDGQVTLRQFQTYGDGGAPSQPVAERNAARTANLLGRLTTQHDEAGLTTVQAADFKGNLLETARRVVADAPILAAVTQASANQWKIAPFQIEWRPGSGQTLAALEAQLLEPAEYRASARFDALSRLLELQLPQDVEGRRRTVRMTYNAGGGIENIRLDDRLYVSRIAYDARGRRDLIAYGNGVMTRQAYDPRSLRLVRLRSERFAQPDSACYAGSGDPFQDQAFEYDLAGNLLAIRDRAPGSGILNNPDAAGAGDPGLAQLLAAGDALILRFTYDPIYRLISATGRECDRPAEGPPWTDSPRCTDLTKARGYTERYRYDSAGNLLSLEHRNGTDGFTRVFSAGPGSNRLGSTQIGQDLYACSFDAGGNLLAETSSRHFRWNHANLLKTFSIQTEGAEPSLFAQYLCDATGQRMKKLVRKQGGQIEVTHYVSALFEHRRWSGGTQSGENNRIHVMDDRQRTALLRVGPAEPGDASPAIQLHLSDHRGDGSFVLDETGALVNREEFTPYGETSFGSFGKKRYRFAGKERDEESGLNYHGARYYAPWSCRWASADPTGIAGGGNLYAYAAGNPIAFVDRRGTDSDTITVLDEDGNVMQSLVINVEGKAPKPKPDSLDSAWHRGFADPMTRDEMERIEILNYENTPGAMSMSQRVAYYRDHPGAYQEYYEALQKRHNDYWGQQEAQLHENYRRTDRAVGAVHEGLAFEVMGATAAVGIGTVGVVGFAKGVAFSFLFAGSTSEGGFHGCGAVAGLGGGAPGGVPAATAPELSTSAAPELAAGSTAASEFRYAVSETWEETGRLVRIVETPAGTRAYYARTGWGREGPLGPQKGDWAPMYGYELGGRMIKAPEVMGEVEVNPATPLTEYGYGDELNLAASQWIKENPLPYPPIPVGDAWSELQDTLRVFGVTLRHP
jgi:RHS repeat-associated protein